MVAEHDEQAQRDKEQIKVLFLKQHFCLCDDDNGSGKKKVLDNKAWSLISLNQRWELFCSH